MDRGNRRFGYKSQRIGPRTKQAVLEGKPHEMGHQHDDRYFTKPEVVTLINNNGGGGTEYYSYAGFAASGITASEVLLDHKVTRDHTFGDNFPLNEASVGTNPAASWVADIQVNNVSVGSLTISTGGVVTWATTGGALSVTDGQVITLIAPAVADASIARLRYSFLAEVD